MLVRCIICLAVLAAAAAFPPESAMGGGLNAPEICRKWPQNRLIVDSGLQSRRFMLEAKGQAQQMPPFLEPGARKIFHRTFSLSLDVAEPIAVYRTGIGKTCVIAQDNEKALPFRVPVFFVGRAGQTAAELRADTERTAFAPSASLGAGVDFAEVNFRLRKGGASFTDIRPFFACGLAGLMLCEGYCPGDTLVQARLLVDWVIRGVEWRAPAAPAEPTPAQEPAAPRGSEAKAPEATPPAPRVAEAPPPAAPVPEAAPSTRPAERPMPPAAAQPPVAAEAPPMQQEAPPVPQPPAAGAAPPAPQEAPPVQQAAPPNAPAPAPALRRLVLVFQRKSGDAISPADILEAEGSIKIEGVPLTATTEGLAAELPDEVFARWNTPEALPKLFPHYQVLAVKAGEARTVVTAEPMQARKTGPILIALVSSDSDFSNQLGQAAVEGFWSAALDLAGSVSEGSWERKLLARAQSPGFSAETGILEDSWSSRLATGPARESILRKLVRGSRLEPGASPFSGFKPIERFQLDLALEPIRQDAGIEPRNGPGQEVLLLMTGGIDPAGGYFCRHPVRPEASPWARPQWVKDARRIFVLEVWSEANAGALQRISRAKPAAGAPAGIYLCNIPGADGANIELYGIVPGALSESARASAFAYLTVQANSYLRP